MKYLILVLLIACGKEEKPKITPAVLSGVEQRVVAECERTDAAQVIVDENLFDCAEE